MVTPLKGAKAPNPGQSDVGAAPWVNRPHGFRSVRAKALPDSNNKS